MIEKSPIEVAESIKASLKRYREQFESNWRKEEQAYYGDIWKRGQYRPYENQLFRIIEGQVPIMTDSLTKSVATTDDPAYLEQAKILTQSIEWVYQNQNLTALQPILVRKALISGPSFLHVYWDENACGGDGEIIYEVLDWKQVYLDGSTAFIQKSNKCYFEVERTKQWLCREFPDHEEKIKSMSGKEFSSEQEDDGSRERYDTGGKYRRHQPIKYSDEDTLKLKICYKRDYTLEPIPEEDTFEEIQDAVSSIEELKAPDTNKWQDHEKHIEALMQFRAELLSQFDIDGMASQDEIFAALEMLSLSAPEADFTQITVQVAIVDDTIEAHRILYKENKQGKRPKYPHYWRVIKYIQKTLVYDGPCEDDHYQIPLAIMKCYDDGTAYGFSESRNLMDSLNMQAVMGYKTYKGIQKVSNPQLIYDLETGLTDDDFSNEDGAKYGIPQGTNIRHLAPGQISEQANRFIQERTQTMQDISGVNEVTQGQFDLANPSGVTVEKIYNNAIGRMRLKQRYFDLHFMKDVGMLTGALIIQHWTSEKVLKLEHEGNETYEVLFNPLEMQDLKWEIKPAPGSMAGIDKNMFNAMLMSFLNAGHITLPMFLKVAEIPRKEKLLELVDDAEQMQQTIQQLTEENELLKAQMNPQSVNPGVPTDQPI